MVRLVQIFLVLLLITTNIAWAEDLNQEFRIKKNYLIERFINYYRNRGRRVLEVSLERYRYYRKIVEAIVEKENLPKEIAYIPIIESTYDGKAISRSKAVGFWQFKYQTAKTFGIEINQYIDERKDIEKSTISACRYIKFLYSKLKDWDLVIAAYNMGRVNLEKIIEKAGTNDFWELVRRGIIRKETRDFVAKFYAVSFILNNGEMELGEPIEIEKVEMPAGIKLSEIARITGISYRELKELNPHINKDIIPSTGANVYLPKDKAFMVKIFLDLRS